MKKGLWLVLISLTLSVAAWAIPALASDPSLWINTGTPSKELITASVASTVGDKYCSTAKEYELLFTTVLSKRLYSSKQEINGCWYKASYGLTSYTNGSLFIQSSKGSDVVRVADSSYFKWYPLPNSNSLAVAINNGSSYFRTLYVVDDVASRLSLSEGGPTNQYTLDRSNSWRLNGTNGNQMSVNAVGASSNGKWLAIEMSNGFIRINVETKEILKFENTIYTYGGGANPNYELTISDDGRYVIIGGGTSGTNIAKLYDLEICQNATGETFDASAVCSNRNLKQIAFPELTASRYVGRALFSYDSSNITIDMHNGSTYDRYAVSAPGYDLHGMAYLALGDSYTSGEGEYDGGTYYIKGTDGDGEGLPGFDTGLPNFPYDSEKCHLSTRSYPYLLATDASFSGDQYKSVACSGSVSRDIIGFDSNDLVYTGKDKQLEQFREDEVALNNIYTQTISNYIPGRAAQIEFVKKYKPKVATIGIGGNDIDFAGKIKSCVIPMSCSWATDLRYASAKQVQTDLYKSLDDMYAKLKNASSNTTFIAIGYPNVISEADDSCAPNVLLNVVERRYAVELVDYMNATIKAVAAKHNIKYLDISDSLQGDRLCDESYNGKAVQGLSLGDDYGIPVAFSTPLGSKLFQINFIGAESYHPTHIGHQMIASKISEGLGSDTIASYDSCPNKNYAMCFDGITPAAPSIPSYFTEYAGYQPEYVTQVTTFEGAIGIDEDEGVQPGQSVNLALPTDGAGQQIKLAPGTANTVTMYSTPQQVGTMNVNANGQVTGSITIPEDAEPGPHTLVINAKDSLYRDMTMYQQIFVYNTLEDFDGDGVQNVDEKCGLVEPINQDEDRDGTDDACDGVISEPPDTTPPIVTSSVTVEPNVHGWYNQAVVVNWAASDDKDTETVAPASFTASQEGEHTYTSPDVCDAAGNCATGSVTLKIDTVPPVVSNLSFSKNPKSVGEASILSAEVSDASSGIVESEYFIADDPGVGNGATMTLDGQYISTSFGTDFGTGVYTISARAQDRAGNWSTAQSDYLVVYDATSGVRLRGARTLSLNEEDNQLPWATTSLESSGKFAFSVRYGNDGVITKQSDFQFAYKTGENCHSHKVAKDCHKFELNATRIAWLTTGGVNHSYGVFRGDGQLTVDGQSQPVQFVVHGVDGERMSPYDEDQFSLTIYPSSGSEPMYFVAPTSLSRGDIKIRF